MIAKIKKAVSYFTAAELILWAVSGLLITSSFFIFARREYLTLAASLVGVTALIFCAKGNPAGQALMILFSAMYGVISFTFAYYGEMMTYLGMSAPMAVFSLVSWLRNPYEGKRSEVKVSALGAAETVCIFVLSAVVTLVFYFILGASAPQICCRVRFRSRRAFLRSVSRSEEARTMPRHTRQMTLFL